MNEHVSLAKEPQKVDAYKPTLSQTRAAPTGKMHCPYCGTENKRDAIFCKKCGKKISED